LERQSLTRVSGNLGRGRTVGKGDRDFFDEQPIALRPFVAGQRLNRRGKSRGSRIVFGADVRAGRVEVRITTGRGIAGVNHDHESGLRPRRPDGKETILYQINLTRAEPVRAGHATKEKEPH